MIQCFYIFICLCFVVLQSAIMAHVPYLNQCYDLLIPFVIYLSIFRHIRGTVLILFFFGFVMDSITGGPFGLYLTTYLWLFFGMRWITRFIDVQQSLLILFVVAIGVVMENLFFMGTLAFSSSGFQFHKPAIDIMFKQIIFAVVTGPFLLVVFEYIHSGLDKWLENLRSEGAG